MKQLFLPLLITLALAFLPFQVAAMSHGHKDHAKHGKTESRADHAGHGDHDDHDDHGDMINLGTVEKDGVKAMAHLKDVAAAMAQMGMSQTHHLMLMFVDEKGAPIEEGTVAVKIVSPRNATSEPIRLHGMEGHFGADIELAETGKYKFQVAARFGDQKARQFHFQFERK